VLSFTVGSLSDLSLNAAGDALKLILQKLKVIIRRLSWNCE